jgi:hypothetical protein
MDEAVTINADDHAAHNFLGLMPRIEMMEPLNLAFGMRTRIMRARLGR